MNLNEWTKIVPEPNMKTKIKLTTRICKLNHFSGDFRLVFQSVDIVRYASITIHLIRANFGMFGRYFNINKHSHVSLG